MAYAQSHPSDSSFMALQTSAPLEIKEVNSMVLLRPTWHCLSSEYPFLVHASVPRFANYSISIWRSAWFFLRSHFRPDIGCFIEVLHYACSLWEMSNIFIGLWTHNAVVQSSIQNYLLAATNNSIHECPLIQFPSPPEPCIDSCLYPLIVQLPYDLSD